MAAIATPAPATPDAKKAKEPVVKATLTGARLTFVVQHARPTEAPCLCGCGGTTKTRFVPGHDAKLKSLLDATVAKGGRDGSKAAQAKKAFGWS